MSPKLYLPRCLVRSILVYWLLATGTIGAFEFGSFDFVFHTPFVLFITLYVLTNRVTKGRLFEGILYFSPFFCFILISLLQSENYMYAWEKIEGGIISPVIMAVLVFSIIYKFGELHFLRSFFVICILFLVITMLYRIMLSLPLTGREGRYFLNGPITYGWIMGLSAVIGHILYSKTGRFFYIFASLICMFIMVGTNSKGPLIAFIITIAVILIFKFKETFRMKALTIGYPLFFSIVLYFSDTNSIDRLNVLIEPASNQTIADLGTFSIRTVAYAESWNMIKDNPLFGVGIGNWDNFSAIKILYPHNYLLEIASELGSIALIFFMIQFIVIIRHAGFNGRVIFIFFSIALLFSGDLSYHRYLFGIPLGIALSRYFFTRNLNKC